MAAPGAAEQYPEGERAGAPPALRDDRPALGDQHLWVNKIDKPLQSALRIRIQASDVSLVLQPPLQTSIRNILRAKVAECFDDNGQVEVQLEVGSRTLWARISPWAGDELGIKLACGFTRKSRASPLPPDYSRWV